MILCDNTDNLIGLAIAPTAPPGDNSLLVANTAFLQNALTGAGAGYRLNRILYYAGGTSTYTPTPGTRALWVEIIGDGGGGGGVPATSSNLSVAGGGGGGGYSASLITSVSGPYTVVVGTGGAGGAAGANAGSPGSGTNFGSGLVVANGGNGGLAGISPGTIAQVATGGTGAGIGTGDFKLPGGNGSAGVVVGSGNLILGYFGGVAPVLGAPFFSGYFNSASFQYAPGPPLGYGHGGAGAFNIGTQTAAAGANGGQGLARVWEFS